MCALINRRAVAERLFGNLKGIFAIYKPRDVRVEKIVEKLQHSFKIGLNTRPCRPIESIVKIDEEKNWVDKVINLADSPLGITHCHMFK